MSEPIGIIAGGGILPLLQAQGIRAAGHPVACVGLHQQFDPGLPALCDHFATARIARVGRWIRLLRQWGVKQTVIVGTVRKTVMYEPFLVLRNLPDWRTLRLWYSRFRHDRRTDALLRGLGDELAREGIEVIESTRYIPEHLASAGVLTQRGPTAEQQADIDFALPIIRRLGDLDIGQSLAVKDRDVIAVEAIEGTDALIERAGGLCRKGQWVLVKIAKPRQDLRFDVPAIGVATIENLAKARAACLAVEAGKVLLLEKPKVIEAANRLGIEVVGIGAGE